MSPSDSLIQKTHP